LAEPPPELHLGAVCVVWIGRGFPAGGTGRSCRDTCQPVLESGVVSPHEHAERTSPEDWQSTLRAKGYRLTPQRELVLQAVEDLGHATPDEVLARVRSQSKAVNVSTVYRTLELLEELGLVRHAHLTDRAPTYHSTATPDHVHLVCRGCGQITELDPSVIEPMTKTLQETYGFTTDVGHLTIFGTCRNCG
jgi:Fur family transcriptional regulator, ferric uptake regulator